MRAEKVALERRGEEGGGWEEQRLQGDGSAMQGELQHDALLWGSPLGEAAGGRLGKALLGVFAARDPDR